MADSSDKWLRASLLVTSFGAASYVLFTGLAMFLVVPGGAEYTLSARLAPALYVLIALIFDLDIAYILQGARHTRFITAFLLSLVITAVGAVLLSLLMFRSHWWELVK